MTMLLNHQFINPPRKYSAYSLNTRPQLFKSLYDEKSFDDPNKRSATYIFAPDKFVEIKNELVDNGYFYNASDNTLKCSVCKVSLKDSNDYQQRHKSSCSFSNVDDSYSSSDDSYSEIATDGPAEDKANKFGSTNRQSSENKLNQDVKSSKSKVSKPSFKTLIEENRKMKEEMICLVCKTEKVQTLFLPCRHLVTCENCADRLDCCCRCNVKILGTVRTYMV